MRVGLAQMVSLPGDVSINCHMYLRLVEQAADAGCELLVLPELSDTGYDLGVLPTAASAWDGQPLRTLQECAARRSLAIAAGLSERTADALYDSLALISPAGELLAGYRKLHLFGREREVFARGDALVTAQLGSFTLGLTICYDLRFPELYRSLALAGADVLVNAAAWPVARIAHWRILAQARAVENQAYYLGCNRAGRDLDLQMGGSSCLVDPLGLAKYAAPDGEELLVGEVDRQHIEAARALMPLFDDRRPDVYARAGS
ncbi:MAG: nitrilase-related carbon-nitrogen hydrolase [Anaerolineae bacterium]